MTTPIIIRYLKRTTHESLDRLRRSINMEGDRNGLDETVYLKVRYGQHTRVVSERHVPGLGTIKEREVTGKDRRHLYLTLGHDRVTVAATAEGVRAVARHIREDDLARLTKHDAEIARIWREFQAARRKRYELLHEAFQRGYVVTVKELNQRAEAPVVTVATEEEK